MSDSEVYDDRVGAFVRHLAGARRARRITGAAVAKAMGVSQPFISKLERGRTDWRLSTALRYADAVGVAILIAEVRHVA